MIIVDSTIPPSTYPRQDYQVLAGLRGSDTTTAVAVIALTGAALFAVHHFIRKPYRRGRVR